MAETTNPDVARGDWIKLLTTHGGSDVVVGHIRTSGLAEVSATNNDEYLIVNLKSPSGAMIYDQYHVPKRGGRWEKLDSPPEFKAILDSIPNTPEVQALKDKVWEIVTQYADRHGYQSAVTEGLKELGIRKPGGGTVTGTVTFTFTTEVDTLISGATATNFADRWNRWNARTKLSNVVSIPKEEDINIEITVTPHVAPVIVTPTTPEREVKAK